MIYIRTTCTYRYLYFVHVFIYIFKYSYCVYDIIIPRISRFSRKRKVGKILIQKEKGIYLMHKIII